MTSTGGKIDIWIFNTFTTHSLCNTVLEINYLSHVYHTINVFENNFNLNYGTFSFIALKNNCDLFELISPKSHTDGYFRFSDFLDYFALLVFRMKDLTWS